MYASLPLTPPLHHAEYLVTKSIPKGEPGVLTPPLPGGGYAMVGIWNNRYVRSAATLRGRAQSSQHQGLKLRSCLGRLVRHVSYCDEQFIVQTQPLEA